jgi:aldehyde dehydrogenase (NAD+)
VWGFIESGKSEGARVVCGGEKRNTKGFYVDPTIFVDIRPNMKIVKEEVRSSGQPADHPLTDPAQIFGPVLVVGKFKTEEEAIQLANDTSYGLGSGLHSSPCSVRFVRAVIVLTFVTEDASQCIRVSNAIEAGTVWINQYNVLFNNAPFGGKKQSGIGRELGSYALEEYTSVKAVHWNFGEKLDWPL